MGGKETGGGAGEQGGGSCLPGQHWWGGGQARHMSLAQGSSGQVGRSILLTRAEVLGRGHDRRISLTRAEFRGGGQDRWISLMQGSDKESDKQYARNGWNAPASG